jgi:ribulose-5-phosphate 4-epimerase/fuculose-1-phosphate aldolase
MPSTRMSEAEWQTRVDLAACYRLVDLFGWSDLINTRITARVPGPDDHFLINPYGRHCQFERPWYSSSCR